MVSQAPCLRQSSGLPWTHTPGCLLAADKAGQTPTATGQQPAANGIEKRSRPQGTRAPTGHPRGTTLLSVTAHLARYGPFVETAKTLVVLPTQDDTHALLTVGESDQVY
jgi:hypothetical protein